MIHFFAPGQPVAKARARHRQVNTKGGKSFVQSYTPKTTRNYENMVAAYAKQQMILREISKGPIKLDLVLFFEVPQSWPAWKREAALSKHIAHTTKPDADNVVKAIKDALNGIVWQDDAQVVEVSVIKLYSDTPGAQIDITELPYQSAQITKKSEYKNPDQPALVA